MSSQSRGEARLAANALRRDRSGQAQAELEAVRTIDERYYLKAMNCPHHHKLFAAEPRSYRDLPLRLAEYGTCYRYEQIAANSSA